MFGSIFKSSNHYGQFWKTLDVPRNEVHYKGKPNCDKISLYIVLKSKVTIICRQWIP